jgi:glutathione S-transferase
MTGYSQAADKRSLGFGIQALAGLILWLGALVAAVWRLIQG